MQRGGFGETAMTIAARQSDVDICNLFLAHKGDDMHRIASWQKVHAEIDMEWMTPLLHAARNGCYALCKRLLAVRADANASSKGVTALMFAASRDSVLCVNALIMAGADMHAVDKHKRSALTRALLHENTLAATLLKRRMNRAALAFVAQHVAMRRAMVPQHWTDSKLFDVHLLREITSYVTYTK
jgi:ankyrin repeat protein